MRFAIVVSVLVAALPAHAKVWIHDAYLTLERPDGDVAPRVDATIIGGPPTACTLRDRRTNTPLDAVRVRGFETEPLALAIVIDTWDPEVDRDEWVPPLPGITENVAKAFDRFDFAKLGPPSSEFTIVGYSTGAKVLQPFAKLGKLAAAVRAVKSDPTKIGTDLLSGVELGLDQLERSKASRKALIVIGDGNDTDNINAKPRLAGLARDARAAHIELFAIIYKNRVSADTDVIHELVPGAQTVSTLEGITSELADVNSYLTDRRVASFPGETLRWDGTVHPFVLQCGNTQLGPYDLVLPKWERPATPTSLAHYILIGGVVMLGLGVLLARRGRRA